MKKMEIKWILVFLGVIFVQPSAQGGPNQQGTEGASKSPDALTTAKTAASDLGELMKETLSIVDLTSAVSLSITNNCPIELTEPKWYMMASTKMEAPPPYTIKSGETVIITFTGAIAGINLKELTVGFGTEGFLTFKIGTYKWLLIAFSVRPGWTNKFFAEIRNVDPYPEYSKKTPKSTFEGFGKLKAGAYGTWQAKGNHGRTIVYSMGGANKAPFQVFLA